MCLRDRGYSILLEKPISPSVRECLDLQRRAEEKGTQIMRSDESIKSLRRRNTNAGENSAHRYGTTFDLSLIHISPASRTAGESLISVPRPAMLVAIVTVPVCPACATISASRWCNLAFNIHCV